MNVQRRVQRNISNNVRRIFGEVLWSCPKTIMNKGNVVKAGGLLAKKMFEANVWSVGSHIQDNMVPFSTVKGLSSPCEGATHRGSATTHQNA